MAYGMVMKLVDLMNLVNFCFIWLLLQVENLTHVTVKKK